MPFDHLEIVLDRDLPVLPWTRLRQLHARSSLPHVIGLKDGVYHCIPFIATLPPPSRPPVKVMLTVSTPDLDKNDFIDSDSEDEEEEENRSRAYEQEWASQIERLLDYRDVLFRPDLAIRISSSAWGHRKHFVKFVQERFKDDPVLAMIEGVPSAGVAQGPPPAADVPVAHD